MQKLSGEYRENIYNPQNWNIIMPFSNFNPPFTNKTLEDFFEYPDDIMKNAKYMRNWIHDTYGELSLGLAYHVPFYSLNGKKLFYFHVVKNDDTKELELEISFVKWDMIEDRYHLFQMKNKKTKAILIRDIDNWFLEELGYYIQMSIHLC